MEEKYWLDNLYEDTYVFNEMAGQQVTFAAIKNQMKRIVEEVNEMQAAIDTNNPTELLDGVVDTYYVLNGLTSILDRMGFNVSGALQKTAENNLSKFPEDTAIVEATIDKYSMDGINVVAAWSIKYQCWSIKDEHGKVRKPVGYVSNDLSEFVPIAAFVE